MSAPQPVQTMTVVHPEGEAFGAVVINAQNFDPAVHTEWVEGAPAAKASPKRGSKS